MELHVKTSSIQYGQTRVIFGEIDHHEVPAKTGQVCAITNYNKIITTIIANTSTTLLHSNN